MISGRATSAGTEGYGARFKELPGHFRPALDWRASSIGLGTYLGEADDETDRKYEAAIDAALMRGINLVDTAVNYRHQRSEKCFGRVLSKLISDGKLRREEVIVATKGGYITFDENVPANARAWFQKNYIDNGIIGSGDLVGGSHCMSQKYLDKMIEMSRRNLQLATIDIYYVHNPESQLPEVGRQEFLKRIKSAFELLERKVGAGEVSVYGVATWNGFRAQPSDEEYLSLAELLAAAREAGGADHHFKTIQLPYNFAMTEAFGLRNQDVGKGPASLLDAARQSGIAVCASASLLQGQLARNLPKTISAAFEGFATDAQRSLQFVRSTPGVAVALTGMKEVAHVSENLETAKRPPAPAEAILSLFRQD